jgi:hypothetical protein
VKPQTIRETLRGVALFEDEGQVPSDGKKILRTDSPGDKRPYPAESL